MPEAIGGHAMRAALFGVGLLLVTAGSARAPTPPPADSTADRATIESAERGRWRFGQLDLQPCEVGAKRANGVPSQAAFCADFPVPEDWDHPAGRQIRLRVAIVRALAAEADRDLVVFLDGGPGGAATQDYPAVARALQPLRKRRHLLLIDQRGTGSSNPLECGEALALDTDDPGAQAHSARPGSSTSGAGNQDLAQVERIRSCAARLAPRAAPQFYATTDAVRDLEAVRQALGAAAFDLVGVSYGTRVAQQYARRYPQAVRSLVLDGPVPNRLALLSEHARNLEEVVQLRLGRCRHDEACSRRFGDSYEGLRRVQAQLRRQPVEVEMRDPQSFALVRRTLGADDLTALVRFYTYNAATSALLPYVISEAQAGRYAPLLSQAQLVVGDVAEHLSGGMSASVLCTEDADLLQERPQDEDTLLGAAVVRDARRACAAWPHRERPADFHEPYRGQIPVLVLAGEFDPVTPPRYGAEIVRDLPRARMLLAPGQGHAVIGVGCMPRLVGTFVEHLDLDHLDDRCLPWPLCSWMHRSARL